MDNQGIASLEFVAMLPMMRRQGLAKTVCVRAIKDAFEDGAKIITLRAIGIEARTLYESLGSKHIILHYKYRFNHIRSCWNLTLPIRSNTGTVKQLIVY